MSVAWPARMPNWPIWPIASAGCEALQRPRQLRRERDGAERRRRLVLARVQVAIQPAVRVLFTPGVAVSM